MRKVVEQGIGQAKITLGILEIDGIDFMRHGGRANFPFDHPLFEVAQ